VTTHDVIVVGASAGGVEALRRLAASFPGDIPAAVFVVLHIPPQSPSLLPEILTRAGPLPALHPDDGQRIEPGKIYVAPPDRHLLVKPGKVGVVRGPSENRHRPAIDALFRSAARSYGPRVIGVVLTGVLDDGTAGLVAVKIAGGIAVVQDPADAFASGMPRTALRYVEADYVLPIAEIGPLLVRLAREPVDGVAAPVPEEMIQEAKLAEMDGETMESDDKPGDPSVFSCPDCGGTLWELQEGDLLRYRCRVGHSYSTDSMDSAQGDSLDRALWAALRALEERSALSRRMMFHARERNLEGLAIPHEKRLRQVEEDADLLRKVLMEPGRT
jgi:two-component system chemotaxis response regulator CheB